jgi:hypothetical protein
MKHTVLGVGRPVRAILIAVALVCVSSAARAETVVVDFGSSTRYLANSTDPGIGMTWTGSTFNDVGWSDGAFGVGYETDSGAENLLLTIVPTSARSVYTRTNFTISDVSQVEKLNLGVDYDDGYVAWLNGVEVARVNLPSGTLNWNTPTDNGHESSNGLIPVFEEIDVTAAGIPALQDGENVLSVAVWNVGAGSSDLVLVPRLVLNPALSVTRGPYLQQGTPDGVVVRWRTALASQSYVYCGTVLGQLADCGQNPAFTTDHIIAVDSLLPDTLYYYAVGTATQVLAGDDADHFFLTSPVVGTSKPTRIWVLGDSGTANADSAAVRDAYYTHTGVRHTDLWLMLGDNAYPDGTDAEYQAAVFDTYPEMLRKSVLWSAYGNHDADSADASTQTGPYFELFTMPTAGEAGGLSSGTEAYYSFEYGNVHFVVLETNGTNLALGGPMLTWLELDLAATAQDWVIALFHHPPYSKGSHDTDLDPPMIEVRENVLPILEDYGVDLTLTGDSHGYERSYLLDGHYGLSSTFDESMKLNGGDGRADGDGVYSKAVSGPDPHSGTVYAVSGCSGKLADPPPPFGHPAIFTHQLVLGSMVLDIDGGRLDALFLDKDGNILDYFTAVKALGCPDADADTVCDLDDNCPSIPNPIQTDSDDDGQGNACDADDDGDGVDDAQDCAPLVSGVSTIPGPVGTTVRLDKTAGATMLWTRGTQGHTSNVYRSAVSPTEPMNGFACFVAGSAENHAGDTEFPPSGSAFYYLVTAGNVCGESSAGLDGTGFERIGWVACDPPGGDFDADGVADLEDNCSLVPDASQADADADFAGDVCDNCPVTPNADQNDCDEDGIGDACDPDPGCA